MARVFWGPDPWGVGLPEGNAANGLVLRAPRLTCRGRRELPVNDWNIASGSMRGRGFRSRWKMEPYSWIEKGTSEREWQSNSASMPQRNDGQSSGSGSGWVRERMREDLGHDGLPVRFHGERPPVCARTPSAVATHFASRDLASSLIDNTSDRLRGIHAKYIALLSYGKKKKKKKFSC